MDNYKLPQDVTRAKATLASHVEHKEARQASDPLLLLGLPTLLGTMVEVPLPTISDDLAAASTSAVTSTQETAPPTVLTQQPAQRARAHSPAAPLCRSPQDVQPPDYLGF